jgi:uncharacterized membrane protein YhaH (DUF805 family)
MDWNWYLFSFEGRINRAKFWLSFPILLGWMIFVLWIMWAMAFAMLLARSEHGGRIDVCFGIQEIFALTQRMIHGSFSLRDAISLAGNLFGMTVFMWIMLAVAIKRLQDRDRSGWWIVPFFVLPSYANDLAGWLDDSFLSFPVALALFILCIWGLIEMGFLRGSFGTNRFGPNPLGKQQARPRDARRRGFSTSGWDQQTEIEFGPHIGSPPPGMHVKRGA